MILNSPYISGSLTVTGNSTFTGTMTATTLVVQTVTSSVNFITGSTKFGSIIGNTHQFTGSVTVTGSLAVVTNGTEFQVGATGVTLGNVLTDNHNVTGSLRITGSLSTTGAATFSSTITAVGYSRFWDGTQGLNIGAFSAGAGYGAIYSTAVTPSTTNFALASNGLSTIINATNDASIVTNNGNGLVVMSTGNVIINNGTTDSGQKLQVVGGNGNQMDLSNTGQRYTQLNFRNNGTQRAYLAIDQTNSEFQVFGQSAFALTLGAGGAERARVTSTGNLLVGGITSTSAYLDGFISVSVPSGTSPAACFKNLNADQFVASFWNNASSGDNIFVRFVSDSGASIRGTIFYSRSNGVARFDGQASGTYSDERLKNIKGEMTYGLDTINKIKTYDFDWKRNGNKGFGVKAQEICELIPEIVEKGNDGEIDPMEFQTTDIWKVNYNELVPVLVKAIQELKSQNDSLQQQINELKAQ